MMTVAEAIAELERVGYRTECEGNNIYVQTKQYEHVMTLIADHDAMLGQPAIKAKAVVDLIEYAGR